MSIESLAGARDTTMVRPLIGRDPDEGHRVATPLELFFDLVFVVAIASAASQLHHAVAEGHVEPAIIGYLPVFFGIWWAWVNFTWFASAYDNDDLVYRLFVFVTMTGALVFAAGVPAIFGEQDLGTAVLGYVIMRVALVTQWVRVARNDKARSHTAWRFAIGVGVAQIGWIAALAVPQGWWWVPWVILVPMELLVPVWAERAEGTTWHPAHITERYGLFMIIVLGESVLAASVAIQATIDAGSLDADTWSIIVGGLLILFSMWWLYFDRPDEHLDHGGMAVVWSYTHYFIFGSAAAVGAGLAVAVDAATDHAEISNTGAGFAVAVPVAVYLIALWGLYVWLRIGDSNRLSGWVAAGLVLLAPLTPYPTLAVGTVLAVLVAFKFVVHRRVRVA